jgi:RNA polymerase sigma-70 factor (ECF subfamily)
METQAAGMTVFSSRYHLSQEQINWEQAEVLAAQKDPLRFEVLYTRYYPRILLFVYQRLDSREAAQDITAEVFYKALDKIKNYKDAGLPFSAWLFRIAVNQLNMSYRNEKTRRTINLDDAGEAALMEEIPEWSSEAADQELSNALQILNPKELDLVDMRFFEKRSFKEISDITGLGESSVKMKLYRILDRLRKELLRKKDNA